MTVISLPFPPSVNNLYLNAPGRGRVPTARYSKWRTEALWDIRMQRAKPVPGAVHVHIRLVAPDKRRRDADNTFKAVLDALAKGNVIEDDSSAYVRRLSTEWADTGEPCIVTITPVAQAPESAEITITGKGAK